MTRRRKAFTAVEVTMVAAVIAILALIILPLFQKRAEKAKIAAAMDDLQGLAKAEILANADADWYFRLQDLDNTKHYDPTITWQNDTQAAISVPYAVWDRALTLNEREVLARRWEGPYIAVQTLSSTLLGEAHPNRGGTWDLAFFTRNYLDKYPILVFDTDRDEDKIPTDPWGGPYIFYAPSETEYNYKFSNAVIYSMGANGLPGDGTAVTFTQDNLDRDSTDPTHLGNGDDFKYVF
jgi:Tfp pilus assembly major pilin PilA